MDDRVPMTQTGYDKLHEQVEKLVALRPKISRLIAEAREKGDLKENAEYHAAREDQGMNEAKIREIESRLARAYIVRPSKTGAIQLGSKIKLLDIEEDFEEDFELVGSGEEDYSENKILTTSPMGMALLEKKVGDLVDVEVPAGKLSFKVLAVE